MVNRRESNMQVRGGEGMNREERLAEEYARNPCCTVCGSPTTKEYAFGSYEYHCSNDFCDHFDRDWETRIASILFR